MTQHHVPPGNRDERRIRFGVLCDSTRLEAWQARCVELLASLPGAELRVLVIDRNARPRREMPWLPRPATLQRRPLVGLPDVPIVRATSPGAIESVDELAPDLLLRFAFDAIEPELLAAPRLGVWSFLHDDETRLSDAPPGYLDLLRDETTVSAVLTRLLTCEIGATLYEGVLRPIRWSWAQHVDRVYSEAARWPAQLCRASLVGLPLREEEGVYKVGPESRPTPELLRHLVWRIASRRVRRGLRRSFSREEWAVGLIRQPLHALVGPRDPMSGTRVDWLQGSPPATIRADPFGARSEEGGVLLFEEWDDRLGRGRIAAAEMQGDGTVGPVGPALTAPHHLSYPFMFEHDGELYCVPESSAAREVALHRCETRPFEWRRVATLIAGEALVDPTLFPYRGLWWLWCADGEGDAASRLRLFSATRLEGPWSEHPRSPVKTDVRASRPAGMPFLHEGVLYRPAQDCSTGYGGSVVLQRVETLTETEYSEREISRIEPDPAGDYRCGLHTVSAFGDWTLVDGKRWRGWRARGRQLPGRRLLAALASALRSPASVPSWRRGDAPVVSSIRTPAPG